MIPEPFHWLLVVVASVLFTVVARKAAEFCVLALWKYRRCPGCRERYAFREWNWTTWRVRHCFQSEQYGDGVICPRCGYRSWPAR
ncbi:MAG TPA: hypothetical protein VM510_04420 [Caulifigura sp.]|nr:hypothetical protein [Caulifigura sp.]